MDLTTFKQKLSAHNVICVDIDSYSERFQGILRFEGIKDPTHYISSIPIEILKECKEFRVAIVDNKLVWTVFFS